MTAAVRETTRAARRRRRVLAAIVLFAAGFSSRPARAQSNAIALSPQSPAPTPTPTPTSNATPTLPPPGPLPAPPNVTLSEDELLESHRGGIPPGSFVWHRWLLFDPYLDQRALVITGGPVRERADGSATDQGGFALFAGPSIETHRSLLFVRGQVQLGFRYTGADHLVVDLGQYTYAAGVTFGPLELAARVGVTVAEVHFGRGGFGLGFLSPQVGAGASLRVGGLRVGLSAFHEYSWRWTSGPGDQVKGFLVDVAFASPPRPPPERFRVEP